MMATESLFKKAVDAGAKFRLLEESLRFTISFGGGHPEVYGYFCEEQKSLVISQGNNLIDLDWRNGPALIKELTRIFGEPK